MSRTEVDLGTIWPQNKLSPNLRTWLDSCLVTLLKFFTSLIRPLLMHAIKNFEDLSKITMPLPRAWTSCWGQTKTRTLKYPPGSSQPRFLRTHHRWRLLHFTGELPTPALPLRHRLMLCYFPFCQVQCKASQKTFTTILGSTVQPYAQYVRYFFPTMYIQYAYVILPYADLIIWQQ